MQRKVAPKAGGVQTYLLLAVVDTSSSLINSSRCEPLKTSTWPNVSSLVLRPRFPRAGAGRSEHGLGGV